MLLPGISEYLELTMNKAVLPSLLILLGREFLERLMSWREFEFSTEGFFHE